MFRIAFICFAILSTTSIFAQPLHTRFAYKRYQSIDQPNGYKTCMRFLAIRVLSEKFTPRELDRVFAGNTTTKIDPWKDLTIQYTGGSSVWDRHQFTVQTADGKQFKGDMAATYTSVISNLPRGYHVAEWDWQCTFLDAKVTFNKTRNFVIRNQTNSIVLADYFDRRFEKSGRHKVLVAVRNLYESLPSELTVGQKNLKNLLKGDESLRIALRNSDIYRYTSALTTDLDNQRVLLNDLIDSPDKEKKLKANRVARLNLGQLKNAVFQFKLKFP